MNFWSKDEIPIHLQEYFRPAPQLGLEPVHDCLGWATGNRCGECYVCRMVEVFRGVWRVLRDDGLCFVNLGSSYASRDMPASQSRRAWSGFSCGSDDTERSDSGDSDRACPHCDGERQADSPIHRDRTPRTGQQHGADEPPPSLTVHDNAQEDSVSASPGASPPCAPGSRTPVSCTASASDASDPACAVEVFLLSAQTSSSATRQCAHTVERNSGKPSLQPISADHTAGTAPSSLACHSPFGSASKTCPYYSTTPPGLKQKDLSLIPARVALALQADGWVLRSGITWAKGVSFCEHYSGSVMPESTRDRPTSASEMIWMLAKSNTAQYWTHRDLPGTRTKPKPDYRYVHATGAEQVEEPDNWKTSKVLCPACGGSRKVTVQLEGDLIGETVIPCELCKGKKGSMVPEWKRINLWQGHDYYYDGEAVREAYKMSSWTAKTDSEGSTKRGKDGIRSGGKGAARAEGAADGSTYGSTSMQKAYSHGGRNLRNVWTLNPQPFAEAHFATFPESLVRPCIQAGSSERGVCPECGAPWSRVVERGEPDDEQRSACGADSTGGYSGQATKNYAAGRAEDPSAVKARILEGMRERRTVEWRPTCGCEAGAVVPATVLDMFAGSGTTLLVAEKLGRDSIGIELNPEYADMARKRIEEGTKQGDLLLGRAQ